MSSVVILTTTSATAQTWTVPVGVVAGQILLIEAWGAGSGASGGNTSNRAGGAGGAYATAGTNGFYITPDAITSGIPFILNTGSAGTAGANSTAGTDTTFGVRNLTSNSLLQGAVVGTPGTLPTNWQALLNLSGATGCAVNVAAVGVDAKGYPYVDLALSGTSAGANSLCIEIYIDNNVATAISTTYEGSIYTSLAAGATNLSNFALGGEDRTSANGYLADFAFATLSLTTTLTRSSGSHATPATGANIRPYFTVRGTAAGAFSGTLRVAGPQIELGSSASIWCATGTSTAYVPYVLAKGGGATSGTTGGTGGAAASCVPSTGAFSGGSGATRTQGGGGGGSAGKDGAGGSSTTGTGATGDNTLGGAAGVSNVEGGGGATASATPSAAGDPGGGGGANTSTGSGSSGGRGQIRLTVPQAPFKQWAQMLPVMAQ